MNLPEDMFRQELSPYLTVRDIVKLDSACMNHIYRHQLLEKINGVILLGDEQRSVVIDSLFKWLGIRRIYFIKIVIMVSDFNSTPSRIENNKVNQFRSLSTLYIVFCNYINKAQNLNLSYDFYKVKNLNLNYQFII